MERWEDTKICQLLVHFSNARDSKSWADPNPAARTFLWISQTGAVPMPLDHPLLLSLLLSMEQHGKESSQAMRWFLCVILAVARWRLGHWTNVPGSVFDFIHLDNVLSEVWRYHFMFLHFVCVMLSLEKCICHHGIVFRLQCLLLSSQGQSRQKWGFFWQTPLG